MIYHKIKQTEDGVTLGKNPQNTQTSKSLLIPYCKTTVGIF